MTNSCAICTGLASCSNTASSYQNFQCTCLLPTSLEMITTLFNSLGTFQKKQTNTLKCFDKLVAQLSVVNL